MTVWRFVVPATNMGERIVPAPHDPSGSGQALIKRTGTWIHEEDWPYISSLKFPCRGIMKDGFVQGCPDAKQMATSPPEPPVIPPPAFFEVPDTTLYERPETMQAPEPKPKRKKRAVTKALLNHYPDSGVDDIS